MRHYRVLCVAGFMLLSGVVSAIAEPKLVVLPRLNIKVPCLRCMERTVRARFALAMTW